jgi:hypothetical protein
MPTMTPLFGGAFCSGDDPPGPFKVDEHRIHIHFSYDEDATAPIVPSALYEICKSYNQNITDLYLLDHAGDPIEMVNWPTQSTFDDRFSVSIIKARKRHGMVGFTLHLKSTFTALKSLARPALLRHHAWLYPHTLAFS